MPTWAQILLAILGGGAAFLLLSVFLIRRFLKKIMAGLAGLGSAAPVRIKAVPMNQTWNRGDEVQRVRQFFESREFRWAGDYALEPMAGTYACVMVDDNGYGAVVYDHPQAGVWCDVVVQYQGRGGLTVSNAKEGGKLASPPFSHKFYLPGGTPDEVWALFAEKSQAVPIGGRLDLTPENIIAVFEQAYADEMDWRNAQGGPTEEEVRRVAQDSHPKASQDEVSQTVLIQQSMASAGLLEGLRDRFRQTMTESDHLRYRLDDLCFVHDRLSSEDLLGFVTGCISDDEWEVTSLPDVCRDLSPLAAFEKLQEVLPEQVRFEKVGELDFPLTTHVYRPPAGRIPIETLPHRRRPEEEEG